MASKVFPETACCNPKSEKKENGSDCCFLPLWQKRPKALLSAVPAMREDRFGRSHFPSERFPKLLVPALAQLLPERRRNFRRLRPPVPEAELSFRLYPQRRVAAPAGLSSPRKAARQL